MEIFIYIIFYLGVFLLGFFGITPILLLESIEEKIPYIILVGIGYPSIIALFVLWRKGVFKNTHSNEMNSDKKQEIQENSIEKIAEEEEKQEEKEYSIKTDPEVEEKETIEVDQVDQVDQVEPVKKAEDTDEEEKVSIEA